MLYSSAPKLKSRELGKKGAHLMVIAGRAGLPEDMGCPSSKFRRCKVG